VEFIIRSLPLRDLPTSGAQWLYGTLSGSEGMLPLRLFGVRRQSEAATALWLSNFGSRGSKAVSRYACHGTPKRTGSLQRAVPYLSPA